MFAREIKNKHIIYLGFLFFKMDLFKHNLQKRFLDFFFTENVKSCR